MKHKECPNCPAIWSSEEIEDQQCSACGYPNNDEDNNDEMDYMPCNICGMDKCAINCPNNESPYAELLRNGYD